jgi:hypothetical protein
MTNMAILATQVSFAEFWDHLKESKKNFNMSKEEYIRVSRSLSHFDILNQFAYRNSVQKGFFPGNLTGLS